jgi:hypothetical protein
MWIVLCVEKGSFATRKKKGHLQLKVFIYKKDVLLLLIFFGFFMHRPLERHFHKFNLAFDALKYLLTDYIVPPFPLFPRASSFILIYVQDYVICFFGQKESLQFRIFTLLIWSLKCTCHNILPC